MSERLYIKITSIKIIIVSFDEFFVDEQGNYLDRYRVDIHENAKGEPGELIDNETGFKTFGEALNSGIEYLGELLSIDIWAIIQELYSKKYWLVEMKKQLKFDIQQRDIDAISKIIRGLNRRLKKEIADAK
jgi:hypothetical protein